jgi:outer membrane protein OmpA-like peptidoglycan-associated protein
MDEEEPEEEEIAEEEMPEEEEEGPVLAEEEPVVEEEVAVMDEEEPEEEEIAEEEMPEEEEGPVLAEEEPAAEEPMMVAEEEEEPLEEEMPAEEEAPEEEAVAEAPAVEEEHAVEDLGPVAAGGETLSYAEEKTPSQGTGASAPQEFPEEPVVQPVVVNFEAEPLFNFDRYNIRSDQRSKLDELVSQLKSTSYDVVVATGHADRIGTDAYNMKLSERRANSVKAYLVRKGIPAHKIRIEAYGESQPVTSEWDCQGKRGRALIVCYQPDRRVDVTVTAEKMN